MLKYKSHGLGDEFHKLHRLSSNRHARSNFICHEFLVLTTLLKDRLGKQATEQVTWKLREWILSKLSRSPGYLNQCYGTLLTLSTLLCIQQEWDGRMEGGDQWIGDHWTFFMPGPVYCRAGCALHNITVDGASQSCMDNNHSSSPGLSGQQPPSKLKLREMCVDDGNSKVAGPS